MHFRKIRKSVSVFAVITATSGLSIGAYGTSAASAQTPVTLTFLNGAQNTVEWFNGAIKQFEAKNPGIKIKQTFSANASQTFQVEMASGSLPDLTSISQSQQLIDQGTWVNTNNNPLWKRMDPRAKPMSEDEHGNTYGIPYAYNDTGLFYNKQVITQLGIKEPTTWSQFVADLKLVKQKKPNMTPLDMAGGAGDSWILGQLVQYFPLNYYQQQWGSAKAEVAMNSRSATASLGFTKPNGPVAVFAQDFLNLKNKGLVNQDAAIATHDEQLSTLASGKAAFMIQGVWDMTAIYQKNPKISLGFWPLPAMYPGTKPHMVVWPTGALSITSASKNKVAAEKFIDFISDTQSIAASYAKLLGGPSVFTDVKVNWAPISAQVDASQAQAYLAIWPSTPAGYGSNNIGQTVQSLLAGSMTPAQFAQQFAQNWVNGFPAQ